SSSGATLRTSDCATQSITGHASPPSAIPSVAPDILRCASVATRTDGLSVVSRTDCLPWHVSFCSDRRCLIRTLAELRHNGHYLRAPKPRLKRPFPFSNRGSFGKFFQQPFVRPAGGVVDTVAGLKQRFGKSLVDLMVYGRTQWA